MRVSIDERSRDMACQLRTRFTRVPALHVSRYKNESISRAVFCTILAPSEHFQVAGSNRSLFAKYHSWTARSCHTTMGSYTIRLISAFNANDRISIFVEPIRAM